LRRDAPRRDEDVALLLEGLFGLHPESGARTLAEALRLAADESGSIELRFRALLGASRTDLPVHLRHLVSLVAGKGHAIDWRDLHAALRAWSHDDERAQRAWARDFWAPAAADHDETQTTDPVKGLESP
jgi:CRISPR type I-E-associated protein CasB/Cse2